MSDSIIVQQQNRISQLEDLVITLAGEASESNYRISMAESLLKDIYQSGVYLEEFDDRISHWLLGE